MSKHNVGDSVLDLWAANFTFGISQPDPTIGRVVVKYVIRRPNFQKEEIPIEMVDCKEFAPNGKYAAQANSKVFPYGTLTNGKGATILCPLNVTSMELTGQYGDDLFTYMDIEWLGCDLGDDLCATNDEVA